MMKMIHTLEGY